MHSGQLVFAQVMTYLPLKAFSRMVKLKRAQHKVKDFPCLDQFLALSFAQLTACESLRDIEINLRVQRQHFYHLGFRCKTISRNTLANANHVRPWEVFADLAHHLIGVALTNEEIKMIENRMNNRLRKRLGFSRPVEVFHLFLSCVALRA